MVATYSVEAPLVAHRTWSRACGVLRLYWRYGIEGLQPQSVADELGVKISGVQRDPMAIVTLAVSADQALQGLRTVHAGAFALAVNDIKTECHDRRKVGHECSRECRAWFNERGTGIGQTLGIDRETAKRWHEAAVWFVHWMLDDSDLEEPEEIGLWLA